MLLLIDNYDSFTWNVAGALTIAGAEVEVVRNDVATVDELLALEPQAICISPGPGGPASAGVSVAMIRAAAERGIPLLGVCLGMQCMGAAFGGDIVRLGGVVHGSASPIEHDETGLFHGLPQGFDAGRYHSLVIGEAPLPEELLVNARTPDGVLMGVRHRTLPMHGVQFHPESILTPRGGELFTNFLAMAEEAA
ncbi:MAG: aminodeoxychorismate/anthranilate synthase component II [Thermoleophilia bacterium]|nr:aminodeoxychorismate/anthranilate synthase component II [Thermoleophilia bacterium]